MNLKRLLFGLGLASLLAGHTLRGEQSESDLKHLADIRAKAEMGDARSQFELGSAFAFGWFGVVKDKVEAVNWYRKAAELNDADAQYGLGLRYANGEGVVKNEVEAVKWFRKAAEQRHHWAQIKLGECYDKGRGVAKDKAEAVKWFHKAAEKDYPAAQYKLGFCYANGEGVAKDEAEAVKWFRRAAEQEYDEAAFRLGICYANGQGVEKNEAEAVRWYHKAAEQNHAKAQYSLGRCYDSGEGVEKDQVEAINWYRKAAVQKMAVAQFAVGLCYYEGRGVMRDKIEAVRWYRMAVDQGDADAQFRLGLSYVSGEGVAKDYVEGYRWWLLAAAQGNENAKEGITLLEQEMTKEQIAEGQKLARNFTPRAVPSAGNDSSGTDIGKARPQSSGTGFFITEDGFLVTNEHVVRNATEVRLATSGGLISAKVVKVDGANDLALLKAEGRFTVLSVTASRGVKLGRIVATVGFPNIGLQGFAPKLAKGEIASLSGAQDDARYFQISVPVQPGNSGGALVDERGNVVGVVSAKLNARAALSTSGALPENVNYAVKSSYLLSFLESVPEVTARLREPESKERKFEEVVRSAEQAAVLVLVY